MRVGLYSNPNRNILTGFADGILALGYSPIWQNPAFFNSNERVDVDFIAIWGGAGAKAKEIISTYARFDIKSLVFENGYVGKDTHSISLGKHYWIPDFECPSDRMKKFDLKLTKERKEDGYVLVLGQSAVDNSNLAKQIKELQTDRKIVFRPHPSIPFKIDGVENIEGSLDEALAGAYCVICHTSNSANQALLKGIPVFCSPGNMAANIANTTLDIDNPIMCSDAKLISYFSRLCYAVWTEKEIKDGTALKFYTDIIKGDNPIKEGVTESVQELKGKFEGQTAYIIGKGPSLKYLSKEDFSDEGGLIVPLNEAIIIAESLDLTSSFNVISQQKDGKPECMVKPESAPLLLHKKESKDWFSDHPKKYIFDLKKDYGLKNNGVSVLSGNCCSVIAAIEFVKFAGCNKIIFMCFDSYTDNINDYPEDGRLGELHSIPERLEHLKGQKIQIPLHIKGIETEFVKPEGIKLPFTVITLTGDRPEAFKLCKRYMARQTVQPEQWIVVDDGKRVLPKKERSGFEYYRRKRLKTDPIHTLRLNMLEALKHVKTDTVVIVEDDDWYREDYFAVSLKHLESSDLVGQNTFFYWNLIQKSYHRVTKTNRPAMCLTAFKSNVFETLKKVCNNSPDFITNKADRVTIDAGSVDLFLWSNYQGTKNPYSEADNLCVGIKGVAGRKGHTLGHVKADTTYFRPDKDAKMLRSLIGKDVENYIKAN